MYHGYYQIIPSTTICYHLLPSSTIYLHWYLPPSTTIYYHLPPYGTTIYHYLVVVPSTTIYHHLPPWCHHLLLSTNLSGRYLPDGSTMVPLLVDITNTTTTTIYHLLLPCVPTWYYHVPTDTINYYHKLLPSIPSTTIYQSILPPSPTMVLSIYHHLPPWYHQ